METAWREDLQDRARIGCSACLSTERWKQLNCPIRGCKEEFIGVKPLVKENHVCPIDGARKAQDAISVLLIAKDTGVFPSGGGLNDQTNAFVQAYETYQTLSATAQNEFRRRKEKK